MSIGGGGGAAMTNGEDLVTGGDLPDKTGKKSPKRATIEFDQVRITLIVTSLIGLVLTNFILLNVSVFGG